MPPPLPAVAGEQIDGLWYVVVRPRNAEPIALTAAQAGELAVELASAADVIRAGFKLGTFPVDVPVVPA